MSLLILLIRNTDLKGGDSMKRKMLIVLAMVFLVTSMPVCAMAQTSRVISVVPQLTFTGTTANCVVYVGGNFVTDRIEAEIKLWSGSVCLATWNASGTGFLTFSDTYGVSRNREYTLTATVEINDIQQPIVSVSKRCE